MYNNKKLFKFKFEGTSAGECICVQGCTHKYSHKENPELYWDAPVVSLLIYFITKYNI